MKIANILIALFLAVSSTVYSAEKDGLSNLSFINYCSDTNRQDTLSPALKKKSVASALVLSLAVPGLGERYAGKSRLSKYLIATETAWWGLYIWHNVYSGWMKDDYITFAAAHAGIESAGKNKKYYVNIGNFSDIYGYNDKKMLDRDDDLVYKNIPENYWRWDSDDNKERFKELKGFLKEAVFLKEEEDLFSENGFQQKEEDNCKLDCERNSHDFSHLASKREAIWWEKAFLGWHRTGYRVFFAFLAGV